MGVSAFTVGTERKLLEAVSLDLHKARERIRLLLGSFRQEPILADPQDREDLRRVKENVWALESVLERMVDDRANLIEETVRAMVSEEKEEDDA